MKFKNLKTGLRVQVKTKNHAGFFEESAGKFGTIVGFDADSLLDVQIKYDDGSIESGNHAGIKRFKGVPLQDLKVGDRVEILDNPTIYFYDLNRGRIGTVTHLDPDSALDVRVEFDNGGVDWGNHSEIRVVNEPEAIKVGTRVRLKQDKVLGFLAGDVGTVKHLDYDGTFAVHFDVARNGWGSPNNDHGIPDLHGLWVHPDDLEVIPN